MNYNAEVKRLVEQSLISLDQASVIQKEHEIRGTSIRDIIISNNIVDQDVLNAVQADELGINRVSLSHVIPDIHCIKLLPHKTAERLLALPIAKQENNLFVAVEDVKNVKNIDEIEQLLSNYKITLLLSSKKEILDAIHKYYNYTLNKTEILEQINVQDDNMSISILIDFILEEAIKKNASDIHFEPENISIQVRYRLNGILQVAHLFHISYWEFINTKIKLMSEMDIIENKKPQDGRFSANIIGHEVDFRVSAHPTIYGEKLVIRILDHNKKLLSLNSLGYAKETISIIEKAGRQSSGLCIVVGPTGSGKTTSLYSILQKLNSNRLNIITLEDPVEYKLSGIIQSDLKSQTHMTFAEGLKSALRQDPDVILLGEIRDSETAQIALRASMTGHKIYTTVHANDIVGAIYRLLDLGVDLELLLDNINFIISQRLVRTLCDECKTEVSWKDIKIFQANNCKKCEHTGYCNRTVIEESIAFDEKICDIFRGGMVKQQLVRSLVATGFRPLVHRGIEKLRAGNTSIKELLRVTNVSL